MFLKSSRPSLALKKFFLKSSRPSLAFKKAFSKTYPSFLTVKEGSTSHLGLLPSGKKKETALRCSEPLRYRGGGPSKVYAILCGMGPPGVTMSASTKKRLVIVDFSAFFKLYSFTIQPIIHNGIYNSCLINISTSIFATELFIIIIEIGINDI